jgi:hypothetical protein
MNAYISLSHSKKTTPVPSMSHTNAVGTALKIRFNIFLPYMTVSPKHSFISSPPAGVFWTYMLCPHVLQDRNTLCSLISFSHHPQNIRREWQIKRLIIIIIIMQYFFILLSRSPFWHKYSPQPLISKVLHTSMNIWDKIHFTNSLHIFRYGGSSLSIAEPFSWGTIPYRQSPTVGFL